MKSLKAIVMLAGLACLAPQAKAEPSQISVLPSASLPTWLTDLLAAKNIELRIPKGGGTQFCNPHGEPPEKNSTHEFICDATLFDAAFTFTRTARRGLAPAILEVRSFPSPEQATAFKGRVVAMWGSAQRQGHGDASFIVPWWEAELYWTEDRLYILYANMWHLRKYANSRAVVDGLAAAATAFPSSGAIGAIASDTRLLFRSEHSEPVPDGQRFSSFVQVIDVARNDTLAVRDRADAKYGNRLTSVPAGTRCVPVVFAPGNGHWTRVKWNGVEGWVSRRYVSDEATSECRAGEPVQSPSGAH